jgi:hypothetical protein
MAVSMVSVAACACDAEVFSDRQRSSFSKASSGQQTASSESGNRETLQENSWNWMEESNGIPCKTRDSKEIAKTVDVFSHGFVWKWVQNPNSNFFRGSNKKIGYIVSPGGYRRWGFPVGFSPFSGLESFLPRHWPKENGWTSRNRWWIPRRLSAGRGIGKMISWARRIRLQIWSKFGEYPVGNIQKAIENGHL